MRSLDADRLRQYANAAAIVTSITVNTLSNIVPPNGINIGKLSNLLFANVMIVPANYAFAIWGVVYLGLVTFGVYQLQPSQRRNHRLQRSGYWLVLASLAQCLWVYVFLSRWFVASVVVMLGILLPLVQFYLRLEIGQHQSSARERWCVDVPASIYLGWISVATVVNIATTLYSLQWSGWGLSPMLWTGIILGVSAAIAATVAIQRHDTVFAGVFVWALVAIAIRRAAMPEITLVAGGLAIALASIPLILRKHRQ